MILNTNSVPDLWVWFRHRCCYFSKEIVSLEESPVVEAVAAAVVAAVVFAAAAVGR
jgi:hypothetical protein